MENIVPFIIFVKIMENIIPFLIFVVVVTVFAYFQSSKVKNFVDTRIFRKKPKEAVDHYPELEPLGGFPGAFKAPSEVPKPVVATHTPKEVENVPLKPSDPIPPAIPPSDWRLNQVETPNMTTSPNFYEQTTHVFTDTEYVKWVPFDVRPGWSGRVKVTLTEAPNSPAGDKATYKLVILDNNGIPVSPEVSMQYTGGSLTGATSDRVRFGDQFIVNPGITYSAAVKVTKPVGVNAHAIVTINGSGM